MVWSFSKFVFVSYSRIAQAPRPHNYLKKTDEAAACGFTVAVEVVIRALMWQNTALWLVPHSTVRGNKHKTNLFPATQWMWSGTRFLP